MLIVPSLRPTGQGIISLVMKYYEVAPLSIVRATHDTFTYASETPCAVGAFVQIPVGKRTLTGLVVREVKKPTYDTKDISELLEVPDLPSPLVKTALWMSDYYSTHLATTLQTVLPRGINKKRRDITRYSLLPKRKRTNFLLNKHQQSALKKLSATTSGTVILHGVTGSGKTAVYIEYAKQLLKADRSVIILVPEIALTSQLVAEFQNHFDDIILTHSKQTEAERHQAWLKASDDSKPHVVIGPRSALFMPLANVGAIIIDEAHEPSFKQDQSPRYSALRVASVLMKYHGGIVVQGSATPLVSEYYIANQSKQPIIHLPEKAVVGSVKPQTTVVDMTKKLNFSRHRFLSDKLLAITAETLTAGHQVLMFHNRRGSASTTLCQECGWSAICPRCFVPYTLHADKHQLRCHICADITRVPTSCPVCYSTDIVHKGIGTKLVESELRRLFPDKVIARFDGDAASSETLEKRYQDLYDGSIDIIVGTQVIAKGLDLPKLRTVGVIQADAGLMLPDFMSSERTFQLLAQVIGRVGRSTHEADVVIQSYQPEAMAVRYGTDQNYAAFYESTLAERKRGHFPPFTFLLKLTCLYKTERLAISHAKQLAETLRKDYPKLTIFGPTPAFYERQHGTYRWQIIVKSQSRATLTEIAQNLPSPHWQYDIDPMSLL